MERENLEKVLEAVAELKIANHQHNLFDPDFQNNIISTTLISFIFVSLEIADYFD